MEQSNTVSPERDLDAEVACPHCERPVTVSVPDREADLTVSQYVAAFGEHSVARCPAGHRFWVYYC
ncbi:hypothetical protein [Haloarcula salina]